MFQVGNGRGKKKGDVSEFDQQIDHFPETVDRLMTCISKVYFDYEQFEKFYLSSGGATTQNKEAMKSLMKGDQVR